MILNINSQAEIRVTNNILSVIEIQERGLCMAGKKIVLIPSTVQILEKMGCQIKKARLRRNIRAEVLAEQAGISKGTLTAIEKGMATVSIGAYAAVLQVLEMENDLGLIASDEEGKLKYQRKFFARRERAAKSKENVSLSVVTGSS